MAEIITKDIHPDYAVPPGEILEELLEERNMSQAALAERTGLSTKHINQIIRGTASITPETALLLERVTGVDASFWTRLESDYRADLIRLEQRRVLASSASWLKSFPVSDLKKRGFISATRDQPQLVDELLRFFNVGSVNAWEAVWHKPTAYRKSKAHVSEAGAVATWLRLGEIEAASVECQSFDRGAFREALSEARTLTASKEPHLWFPQLQHMLANCGVAVVIVEEIGKTRVCGAARWTNPSMALIQLSLRYRWVDAFWFNFFHEAAHLLHHGKKDVFVSWPGDQSDDVAEAEADEFASRELIPVRYENRLREIRTLSEVSEFALEVGVGEAIIVGRLQHEGILARSVGNGLRQRLQLTTG